MDLYGIWKRIVRLDTNLDILTKFPVVRELGPYVLDDLFARRCLQPVYAQKGIARRDLEGFDHFFDDTFTILFCQELPYFHIHGHVIIVQ